MSDLRLNSGLALAVHPADDSLNQHLAGDFADKFFAPGKVIGSFPFVIGTGITTYLVGRIGDHPRGKHLGMDLIEATLLSEGITQGIKYSVRRERPIAPDGSQASGYAFPSGHATVTFAAATVLQQHLGWKAAVPTYLVASYVAISRLHLSTPIAVSVALLVAIVKGSLVACYFMHLISERRLILAVLVLTAVFFAALLALPALTHQNGFWIHHA